MKIDLTRFGVASRALRNDTSGQSIVELAVMTPLLLLLVVGVIDLGEYAYDGIELGNAARAGAEYGATNSQTASGGVSGGDPSEIRLVVQNDAKQLVNATGASTVVVTPTTFCVCDTKKDNNPVDAAGNVVDCNATNPCATTGDRLDVFVKVEATDTFTPNISIPGFAPSISMDRVAYQQMSPQ